MNSIYDFKREEKQLQEIINTMKSYEGKQLDHHEIDQWMRLKIRKEQAITRIKHRNMKVISDKMAQLKRLGGMEAKNGEKDQ